MTRNIDYRVEVICPVKDADAQRTLQDILDQQWNDNCKARVIDAYQSNNMVTSEGKATLVRSQETIHRYLETGSCRVCQSHPCANRRFGGGEEIVRCYQFPGN